MGQLYIYQLSSLASFEHFYHVTNNRPSYALALVVFPLRFCLIQLSDAFRCFLHCSLLVQAFPVHGPMKAELLETWGDFGLIWPNFHNQPIDVIQDYFGVRIALYFSFLGSMAFAQYPIAIIGAIFYGTSYVSDSYRSWASVPFTLLMMLWTLALQYSWDRVRLSQVHSWGMIGFKDNEDPRPEFSHSNIPIPFPILNSAITVCQEGH